MGIGEVVEHLERQGAILTVTGDRVRLRAPADHAPSLETVENLRSERQALIAYLRARTAARASVDVQNVGEAGRAHVKLPSEKFDLNRLAPCKAPQCAGCYVVDDETGARIHPPKSSRSWLERWQPNGKPQ
jgi:hypothetical protein